MTLLVGDDRFTWREWIKASGGDMLCLDPADADHGPPARGYLHIGGKVSDWRLIGSIDAMRNPVAVMAAAWTLMRRAGNDTIVQLFSVKQTPVSTQTALALAQCLNPVRVLVPAGSGLETMAWPVGAEPIELPSAFPRMVVEAQRRARWLEMLESSEDHVVDLNKTPVDGSRLGSGRRLQVKDWGGWAEVGGGVLHLVGDQDPDEGRAAELLDHTHANRISIVSPDAYRGLVCSFASQEGEDFGIGLVQEFQPERGLMRVKCTAVSPAPIRLLRLGTLRIDESGRELGDVKPWSL